jgi:ribosome-associated protein
LARSRLEEKKAGKVIILDVRKVSTITNYYVIATGNNPRHLQALLDEIETALAEHGQKPYRLSGTPESGWMIIDYLDFVVHVFSQSAREHYALETLWKDAPRLK